MNHAKEALKRLKIMTVPTRLAQEYYAGRTTPVPTGRSIEIKGRIQREIGYGGASVSFEPAA